MYVYFALLYFSHVLDNMCKLYQSFFALQNDYHAPEPEYFIQNQGIQQNEENEQKTKYLIFTLLL